MKKHSLINAWYLSCIAIALFAAYKNGIGTEALIKAGITGALIVAFVISVQIIRAMWINRNSENK